MNVFGKLAVALGFVRVCEACAAWQLRRDSRVIDGEALCLTCR